MYKSTFTFVCVALSLAAGCSPSDQTSTTTTATVSKEEFVGRANEICTTKNEQIEQLKATKPSTPEEAAAQLRAGAAHTRSVVTELQALPQPAGDVTALQAMYADAEGLAQVGERMAEATEQGDRSSMVTIQSELEAAEQKANASATAFGLTECAS